MPYHSWGMDNLLRHAGQNWDTNDEAWSQPPDEGQLSVDIFRDDTHLVVRSLVAGVAPENLDIALHDDLLTIRGERKQTRSINEDDWFYKECYWGGFSRSIILPTDVQTEHAEATLKNGLLEIRMPIRVGDHRITVRTMPDGSV